MEVYTLISDIKARGLDIRVIEGNLHVSPRAKITDDLRKAIKENKAPLVYFLEVYEERAAIMEYGAGLSREDAEKAAMEDTKVNLIQLKTG